MTPRKAGRRKSGTGRRKAAKAQRIQAWAVTDIPGVLCHVFPEGDKTLRLYDEAHLAWKYARENHGRGVRVVPCEIVIGRKK